MKRELAYLALIILAVCLMASCGVETAEVSLPPESAPAESAASPGPDGDLALLRDCAALLGMDDAESAGMLGGGEQNYAAGGEILIGRVYSAGLFGEEVAPSTSYGPDGLVDGVSIYLSGTDAAAYAECLSALLGEPEGQSGGVSEGGGVWTEWRIEGARLRLHGSLGLCSLEIS